MSASLVGSEMCIRDSPSTRGAVLRAAPPAPGSAAGGVSDVRRFGAAESCLLYTSDAADDM
eukprot:15208748-Alexandrium_andersonii.AAC.1